MPQFNLGTGGPAGEPVEILVGDELMVRLTPDVYDEHGVRTQFSMIEFFTNGVCAGRIEGGEWLTNGPFGSSPSSGGTRGDIILPNHNSSIRGASRAGFNHPLVKMTCNDTPSFGSTIQRKDFPHNEAVAIGWPAGVLVVTDMAIRASAQFILSGPPENPITLPPDNNPTGLFSIQDAEEGKIVVCFDPNQIHPINGIVVGGFQIQNRTGRVIHLGWSHHGTL